MIFSTWVFRNQELKSLILKAVFVLQSTSVWNGMTSLKGMHCQNWDLIDFHWREFLRNAFQCRSSRLKNSPLPFININPMKFRINKYIPACSDQNMIRKTDFMFLMFSTIPTTTASSPSRMLRHRLILWSLRKNIKIVRFPNVKKMSRKTTRQLKANTLNMFGL